MNQYKQCPICKKENKSTYSQEIGITLGSGYNQKFKLYACEKCGCVFVVGGS
jgi:uncharacterized protein with PIN domain